ncbi:hypothetical protein MNEG_8700 [Monoraphidium neglectum]|uniref:Exocyst complex component EXOC6/Sec15 N-terminal domain-containing protein n=1 Tax=Monoraphidium neglectum TaxID=145388 RepID=A0A0D2MYL8_9CHLO|nr:hypothetical protein MNEG_8700 [Monoraphidium neglectum]KIY99260.1 hypothetical protein MNEG_8700 [Monoraphidium neglectum]|eukprot:XP_013898280.1 hypothetical protein MNEG_8700 [Monoraphidium neglectum]
MCALYVNTSREREGGGSAPEEANIRELVEKCAHNDDITPLVRLMFEAQAVPDSPQSIDADGKQMVSIIGSCLKAVAAEQQRVVGDVARGNAIAIATTVGEVEKLGDAVRQVRAALVGGSGAVQASGGALAAHAGRLATAAEVRENLARAAHALAAARAVLRQCLAAGQLVSQQQLYHALCSLDVIRQKHLGAKGRGVHLI